MRSTHRHASWYSITLLVPRVFKKIKNDNEEKTPMRHHGQACAVM